jgi:hypothetical protein
MPRHAAHQHQLAATRAQRRQGFLDRAQQTENIGLELPAVVLEREPLHAARHPEAGIGVDDVDANAARREFVEGPRHVAVAGDVTLMDADLGTERPDLRGQRLEQVEAAGEQRESGTATGVFARESGADARRGAGDEDSDGHLGWLLESNRGADGWALSTMNWTLADEQGLAGVDSVPARGKIGPSRSCAKGKQNRKLPVTGDQP